jgi:hypothetical protein
VFLNGVLLARGSDYTATDGTSITFSETVRSGDVVEIISTTTINLTDTYTQGQIDALISTKANIASPTFTGIPSAPTASPGTNTTQIATTAFVYAGLDLKAPLNSPTFTGSVTVPSPTNSSDAATKGYVDTQISNSGGYARSFLIGGI